jgi:hypothetical protein
MVVVVVVVVVVDDFLKQFVLSLRLSVMVSSSVCAFLRQIHDKKELLMLMVHTYLFAINFVLETH